jgi:hypothetical protein
MIRLLFSLSDPGINHLSLFANGPKDYKVNAKGYITKDDLRSFYEAVGKELGLGWLPYPENRPGNSEGYYFVTVPDENGKMFITNGYWTDEGGWYGWGDNVVAFYYKPDKPYQP